MTFSTPSGGRPPEMKDILERSCRQPARFICTAAKANVQMKCMPVKADLSARNRILYRIILHGEITVAART